MADFRRDPGAYAEFYAHLIEFESAKRYFYCDSKGLVTIAVGYLVDQERAADAVGERLARTMAGRRDIGFTRRGSAVGPDEVAADWQRVKTYGRSHSGAPSRDYESVAQLQIGDQAVRSLTSSRVMGYANSLYENRPFMLEYHPLVAVALLDARFNPAAVPLYTGAEPDIPKMWNALNPAHRQFAPATAIRLFEDIWAKKRSVPPRYILRHSRRVAFMLRGLRAMGYQ